MAAISTLTDNFNTAGAIDGTKWTFSNLGLNGTAAYAGGVLVLDANTTTAFNGECHLTSLNTYDITGDGAYVNVTSLSSDPTRTLTGFEIHSSAAPSNEKLQIYVDETNTLYFLAYDNTGVAAYGGTLTYAAATHAWWRIREASGVVYWDTAPSTASNPPASSDWVNRGSYAFASLSWTGVRTSVHAKLYFRLVGTGAASAPTANFDGFNANSGAGGASYEVAITETAPLAHSQTVIVGFVVSRTETATITQAASAGTTYAAAVTEAATIADTNDGVEAYADATTETMTIADTVDGEKFVVGDITEGLIITDVFDASTFWVPVETSSDTVWTQITT